MSIYTQAGFVVLIFAATAATEMKRSGIEVNLVAKYINQGRVLAFFPVFFCAFIGRGPRTRWSKAELSYTRKSGTKSYS